MSIEEEYPDVLQNIEFRVIRLYRAHPEMTDYAVLRIYEALAQLYSAEMTGRPPKPIEAEGLEAELFEGVKQMCELRLGRASLPADLDVEEGTEFEPIEVETLVRCLKRLVNSVSHWTRLGGRQGYLNFVSEFVV